MSKSSENSTNIPTTAQSNSDSETPRRVFSRDLNYLRDVFLFWPFVLFTILSVGCLFSGRELQLGIRFAMVAIIALFLSKEKLLVALVAMGFVAIQGIITFFLQRWNGRVLIVTLLTGIPFLIANRYWRHPKLKYQVPEDFRLIDALWSILSLCAAFLAMYLIRPQS